MKGMPHYRWPVIAASAALLGSATMSAGQTFMTETQALQAIFGQDALASREVKTLPEAERGKLEASSGLHFLEKSYNFLVVAKQGKLAGYAIVLDEIGKSEPITLMVGMTPEGKVVDVAVLVFRESRGWEIKEKRFLKQFHGKGVGDSIQVDRDIINYSGATFSSKALARGVKRALLLFEQFYPRNQRHVTAFPAPAIQSTPPEAMAQIEMKNGLVLYHQARVRMGTVCEIRLWASSPQQAYDAFNAGFHEIARLDRVFSSYRDDSDLARVNNEAFGAWVDISREFWDLSRFALRWFRLSKGTFDITVGPMVRAWGFFDGAPSVPSSEDFLRAQARIGSDKLRLCPRRGIRFLRPGMEIDFGGLAKGYASDRAADLAVRAGASFVLVNLGSSSLSARGAEQEPLGIPSQVTASGSPDLCAGVWPVAVKGINSDSTRYMLLPTGWTLSTSGTGERSFQTPDGSSRSHIIDPRSGKPLEGSRSTTVVTRTGSLGEALTKPLLLLQQSEQTTLMRHLMACRSEFFTADTA